MKIERIKELRQALKDENISYFELMEIDNAANEAGIEVKNSLLAEETLDKLEEKYNAQR